MKHVKFDLKKKNERSFFIIFASDLNGCLICKSSKVQKLKNNDFK